MAIHGITWLYMATHSNTMQWAFTCYFHSSIISYHFIHSLLITHFRSNYYDTYYLRWHRLAAYLPAVFQFHSQFLLTIITHVEGSSRIDYISHSNIRTDVETRFPPLFHPDIFWAPPPPPRFARFCDTRISSIMSYIQLKCKTFKRSVKNQLDPAVPSTDYRSPSRPKYSRNTTPKWV